MKKVHLAMPKVSKEMSLGSVRSYRSWILDLRKRYKATQCKAAVAVNSAMLEFYWNLGKDISVKYPGRKRGLDFFGRVSRDVNEGLQAGVTALSTSNIRYAHRFYVLYASYFQQLAEINGGGVSYLQQLAEDNHFVPQLVEQYSYSPRSLNV